MYKHNPVFLLVALLSSLPRAVVFFTEDSWKSATSELLDVTRKSSAWKVKVLGSLQALEQMFKI